MIFEAQFFFDETPEFYHYCKSRSKHLDDKYFARTNKMKLLNLLLHSE